MRVATRRPAKLYRVFQFIVLVALAVVPLANAQSMASRITPEQTGLSGFSIGGQKHLQSGEAAGISSSTYFPMLQNGTYEASWSMAGANPGRTSWVPEEVSGKLKPLWYRPFEAYIPQKVQIITAYNKLYVSTASGLYALHPDTGEVLWVYPTSMPLGNSPTIYRGIAYVGGYDHKLHAVNAFTGQPVWTFEAGAGFDTNPLVVNGKIYAGSRDGFFYAIYASGPNMGTLAWKYQTGGPIHFSAAYNEGALYFASDDSYAYALNAQTGSLIWKSAKLLGAGFHSWWPVVAGDWVIFPGSNNYRSVPEPGTLYLDQLEKADVFPNYKRDPEGTLVGPQGTAPGDWVAGTTTIDTRQGTVTTNGSTTPVTQYLENKPWRRTYFVLNRATGQEYTSDFDQDGKPEYAPVLWLGTRGAGNRYPPVVGSDRVLYQANNYASNPVIARGHVSGWSVGSPYISVISSRLNAVDEPLAYSGGGDLIYYNRCCDRIAGSVDISKPLAAENREWVYFSYNLPDLIPQYNIMTYPINHNTAPWMGLFVNRNGVYGWHGDVNPPIPYRGKVFMHRSNAIIAFAPDAGTPAALPTVAKPAASNSDPTVPTEQQLRTRLAEEVQKMIAAGHLRPGYLSTGIFDTKGRLTCGDNLVDYFHHPGDVISTLIAALPYLPADLQQQTRTYLQSEFTSFPPYQYNHTGWRDGAAREPYFLPPEVDNDRAAIPPAIRIYNFPGWSFAPQQFYALWKYAQVFGGAQSILNASQGVLFGPPSNAVLEEMPHIHNAFIAGYIGYLELQKLAGVPENATIRNELNRLMALRSIYFSKDTSDAYFTNEKIYCRTLNVSRNFMYLVPELGQYMHGNALPKVQQALDEYQTIAPLWFVTKVEAAFGEGVITPLYDSNSIFLARAYILQQSRSELVKYLDVPAFQVGDLFYIQNLVAVLQAQNN